MFSLRLPIPLENTLTPPPKTTNPAPAPASHSYSRSQTHRYLFPSQPVTVTKRGATAAPPNVALRDDAEGGTGTSVAGDLPPDAEPMPAELREELMPKHVAVIMDGNGRWAKMKGLPPSGGHEAGVRSLRNLVRLCGSWGIRVLTVFAFSTDNWVRPKVEVDFLLSLFERTINSEIEEFKRKNEKGI